MIAMADMAMVVDTVEVTGTIVEEWAAAITEATSRTGTPPKASSSTEAMVNMVEVPVVILGAREAIIGSSTMSASVAEIATEVEVATTGTVEVTIEEDMTVVEVVITVVISTIEVTRTTTMLVAIT